MADTASETSATPEAPATSRLQPSEEAVENLVLRHAVVSAGAGLIPLPLLDMAAITAVNLRMLKELADLHGVEFRPELARSAFASLLATAGGGLLLVGPVSSLFKAVPGVGSIVGGLASPGVMGGLTYATGKVFARHFATGGDLISFKASRFKDMFKREAKEGQEKAAAAAAPAAPAAATA